MVYNPRRRKDARVKTTGLGGLPEFLGVALKQLKTSQRPDKQDRGGDVTAEERKYNCNAETVVASEQNHLEIVFVYSCCVC